MTSSPTKTCEFVSPKHPDKQCDYLADSILDAYLQQDPETRAAIEIMAGHGQITVNGEITSQAAVGIEDVVKNIAGPNFTIRVNIAPQSPSIAHGVDAGGAGDQGIMEGYAVAGTPGLMPYEYELARSLCQGVYQRYPQDGKVQVTARGKEVLSVVASFQHAKTMELEKLVRELLPASQYLINPVGDWDLGGFDADTGLSGRKIVVDNYGPEFAVGGGSFSGKDYTKVDRSGAYMARKIAVDLLVKHDAQLVRVKLAYAIGKAKPVMAVAEIDGIEAPIENYDLTPDGIKTALGLDQVRYADTAQWGHFGRGFPWDQQKNPKPQGPMSNQILNPNAKLGFRI